MADWTSQPPDGTLARSEYTGALFLWNAIAPTKDQLTANTATLRGTTHVGGADGQYHVFDGPTTYNMQWSITKPASAYTLVVVSVHPTASIGQCKLVSIPGGNFRLESYTTGGGVYHEMTHTGSASAANSYAISVGGFDSQMWTYVAAYNGTTLRQYEKQGDGTNSTSYSETIAYNNSGSSVIDLGSPDTLTGQGLYAVLLLDNDVGDTECLALRDNAWRMFAPDSSGQAPRSMHQFRQRRR